MQTKICTKCRIEKTITEFYSEKSGKFGVKAICKECKSRWSKEYNQKQEIKEHKKIYQQSSKYKERRKEYQNIPGVKESQNESHKKHFNKFPWKETLVGIKYRCNNTNCDFYHNYGGRGIQCQITAEELKEIWFRDNADSMIQPSIHRKNNDGNYILDNCEYIEWEKHDKYHKEERKIRNSFSPAPQFLVD